MKKEELLDKYIKYNSKITFDIFKLIYQKLIDLGFTSPHKVEDAFTEFSGKYNYFVMQVYDDELYFNQFASVTKIQSEISVEDLLGYNPFESFKLPEKWYIEVGENTEIINKWKQTTRYTEPVSKYKYVTCRGSGYNCKSDYTDHSELTIEQFKQYVLKEPIVTKPPKPFPTHWRIELNKETLPIVGVYYNKKHLSDPNCDTYTGKDAIGYYVKSHNVENEYIKNGYTSCSFFDFGKPSDLYPEITLEQFKEFVMNEPIKTETSKTEKVESTIEYAECIGALQGLKVGQIYEVRDKMIGIYIYPAAGQFKPSTKEAFEAQNKPKSIEKWSVGSYIVPLQDKLLTRDEPLIKGKPYQIIKRINLPYIICEDGREINFFDNYNSETTEGIKWFAAKSKAEEFAKTLIDPVKEVIQLTEFPIEGRCKYDKRIEDLLRKNHSIYESSRTVKIDKVKFICWNSEKYWYTIDSSSKKEYLLTQLESFLIKQPLKQVVHCKTQEEWDFVTDKLGYKWTAAKWKHHGENSKIDLNKKGYGQIYTDYLILSFQEWCDLNGYKMKKTRFKAGDYVVSLRPENLSTSHIKSNYCYIQYKDEDRISINSGTIMCEDNINYARLATPEEIEKYKRIGKPYDVTTLQPSINTYGLKVGDHLDESTICAWTTISSNRYQSGEANGNWRLTKSAFSGDRKIESFKVIKGVVGFLVSGTNQVYLRAEGFKEFAEKFNKSEFSSDKIETTPKFEVGKWYQGKNENCYGKLTAPIEVNDEFPSSEYISSNGVYCSYGSFFAGFAGEEWTKFAREVPLSEIQQFLPDGHPDKFINSTEMNILTNSFYRSPGIKKTKSDKEEIYLLPDPD